MLAECRGSRRRLVWEIGGSWGGFAYQFKTICPNVTYLVTGIPDLLLVSAVYLMTAFPCARCHFYDPSSSTSVWRDWEDADFIFAPETAVADMDASPIDVTLDIMSLETMSVPRVSLHVQRAFDLGSRYFLSQVPGPCFPQDVPNPWRAVERLFWPHLIPPRLEASAFVLNDDQDAPSIDGPAHIVGWRRIRV